MPKRPAISPDWKEGRYFDRWMLVHFMSGVAGGFSNVWFELGVPAVLLLGLAMMVAWEFVEVALGVDESAINRVIDVVVGGAGVGLALLAAAWLPVWGEWLAFGLTWGVAIVGGIQGARAAKRRRSKVTAAG
jgi:hypothetical protein